MIPSFITLFTAVPTAAIVIMLMFLPAIIELKKPQDAGPRSITNFPTNWHLSALKMDLFDIEDELKLDSSLVGKVGSFLSFIPNLES
jgi:hypothetical protein